ncbi:uncharacterized protein A4U43_C04F27780 [Asparagus officinalis]|uniref:Ubiquitin-like protease family profile domain-containing protein n=1 Tax=Asparagus officinalis TaxID=4686 RepID=A0A5P1F8R6_ASPOF|nr:uncharacterized protein A4U43_C04F27780 [Asparagus officinalis]
MVAKRMKENVSQQKLLECERILIPIVRSGHWHMVELVREEKKFYHYSSIKSLIYTADATKFRNKFMSFIQSNWRLRKLEHHVLESVATPQQGPTLDCGIFMIEFINNIVEKQSITISEGDCAKYRAKFCAALFDLRGGGEAWADSGDTERMSRARWRRDPTLKWGRMVATRADVEGEVAA